MLLNSSLASGLGRPDLAFAAGSGPTQQIGSPAGASSTDASVSAFTDIGSASGRGPILVLMVLVGGLFAFGWWVRPHLA
jgi:hypothetical protein